jgi:hypothetical protein
VIQQGYLIIVHISRIASVLKLSIGASRRIRQLRILFTKLHDLYPFGHVQVRATVNSAHHVHCVAAGMQRGASIYSRPNVRRDPDRAVLNVLSTLSGSVRAVNCLLDCRDILGISIVSRSRRWPSSNVIWGESVRGGKQWPSFAPAQSVREFLPLPRAGRRIVSPRHSEHSEESSAHCIETRAL